MLKPEDKNNWNEVDEHVKKGFFAAAGLVLLFIAARFEPLTLLVVAGGGLYTAFQYYPEQMQAWFKSALGTAKEGLNANKITIIAACVLYALSGFSVIGLGVGGILGYFATPFVEPFFHPIETLGAVGKDMADTAFEMAQGQIDIMLPDESEVIPLIPWLSTQYTKLFGKSSSSDDAPVIDSDTPHSHRHRMYSRSDSH